MKRKQSIRTQDSQLSGLGGCMAASQFNKTRQKTQFKDLSELSKALTPQCNNHGRELSVINLENK